MTVRVRTAEYNEAARAAGVGFWAILFRHVLPNSYSPILVLVTLQAGVIIIETAGLSFLGLGAQPPAPDWGALLADGQSYQRVVDGDFSGSCHRCRLRLQSRGDALRDYSDPRART